MLDVHLQDTVLRGRLPAVRPEKVLHRIMVNPRRPDDASTKCEECSGSFNAQRVCGTGERQLLERGSAGQIVDHVQCADHALQRGSSGRRLKISGAVAVEEADDLVAAEVRGVCHGGSPVAVGANQDMLVDQRRIGDDERADGLRVVAPDRLREPHPVDEPCPTRRAIAPCEDELCIGQLRGGGINRFRMMVPEPGDGARVAGADGAEEFFGLTLQLLQVGADR